MGFLGVPVLLILAVFLAGCAPHTPVLETRDDVSTATAQPDPRCDREGKIGSQEAKAASANVYSGIHYSTEGYDKLNPRECRFAAKMGKRTRGG